MKYLNFSNTKLKPLSGRLFIALTVLFFAPGCGKSTDPVKTPDVVIPPVVVTPVIPTTANLDKLTTWKSYISAHATSYNLVILGDSYVQGDYFTYLLRAKLLNDGNLDGGPGYCSFGRFDPTGLYSIDSSIDPTELTFTYDPLQWKVNQENTVGPCGDVISNADNSLITVTANVALDAIAIVFEQHPNAGNFRYRLNGGSWVTVSAVATEKSTNSLNVKTSSAGAHIILDIESLTAGQRFCGVVGKRNGNLLTLDKAGMSGGLAVYFGQDYPWQSAIEALAPKGAVIMFGTNEQKADLDPDNLKVNVQYMIDHLRNYNPTCDIILMSPPETAFETEETHKYKLADYRDVMYKLALANNAAFINLQAVFPHFTQASITEGYMDTDRVHPGSKGGELIAQTIFNVLKK